MRYSLGHSLADFGFNFLEKIHEPIFLIHNKLKTISKINEAGRKFLKVGHVGVKELNQFVSSIVESFDANKNSYRRIRISDHLIVIARRLVGSDYILVEIQK